jgi:hypothetical protein
MVVETHLARAGAAPRDLARHQAEHSSKGAGQVRRIGEPGDVGGFRQARGAVQGGAGSLDPQPQDITTHGDADRRGEQVGKTRRR